MSEHLYIYICERQCFNFIIIVSGNLVTGSADYTIRLWNPTNVNSYRTILVNNKIFALIMLPDGTVAVGISIAKVKIYSLITGAMLRYVYQSRFMRFIYSYILIYNTICNIIFYPLHNDA